MPRYADRSAALRREIAIVIAGAASLLAAAYAIWYFAYFANSPRAVVQRFMDADRAGALTSEQQYVVNRWDARMAMAAFQSVRRQVGSSPFATYSVGQATITNTTASVPVDLTFTPPATPAIPGVTAPPAGPLPAGAAPTPITYTVDFVLLYEDGRWRIDTSQTLVNAAAALAAIGYTRAAPLLPLLQGLGAAGPAVPATSPGLSGVPRIIVN